MFIKFHYLIFFKCVIFCISFKSCADAKVHVNDLLVIYSFIHSILFIRLDTTSSNSASQIIGSEKVFDIFILITFNTINKQRNFPITLIDSATQANKASKTSLFNYALINNSQIN